MTSLSFFWIARNDDGFESEYVVSAYPLERITRPGPNGGMLVEWETGRGDDVRLCVAFWHLAGGPILEPGDGPRRVHLKLLVRFVSEDVVVGGRT